MIFFSLPGFIGSCASCGQLARPTVPKPQAGGTAAPGALGFFLGDALVGGPVSPFMVNGYVCKCKVFLR